MEDTTVKIIAFSSNRSEKITKPLGSRDDVTIVSITSEGRSLSQYVDLLQEGRTMIENRQPQAIFVNQDGVTAFLTALLSLWYRKPLIVRLGGDPWLVHRKKLIKAFRTISPLHLLLRGVIIVMNRLTFRIAAGFIVVSDELRQRVQAATNCSPSNVRVVHTSIDVSDFDMSTPQLNTKYEVTEDVILLTVTNLEFEGKYEGVHDLLRPIDRILSDNKNVCYVIAGGGRYLNKLQRQIEEEISPNVRDRIYLLGYINNIHSLYINSDIFLYMSYIDGYPNVVLEAKAASMPIITNPKFGMIEQINDGETGYLVSATDTDEIEHRIARLIRSHEERSRLGRNARREVERENNPVEQGQELVDAICELC